MYSIPIRNDDHHHAAVQEIDSLWGAAQGTADDDRLEVLATLVDLYENHRWPILDNATVETVASVEEDAIGATSK